MENFIKPKELACWTLTGKKHDNLWMCVPYIWLHMSYTLEWTTLQASLHLAILEIVGRGRGTPTSCIKWCHDLIEARTSLGCLACFNMLQHASTCFNMLQPPSLYAVVHICIYMLQHGHILQHTSTYFFHSYLNSYIMDMLQLALLCAVYHICLYTRHRNLELCSAW